MFEQAKQDWQRAFKDPNALARVNARITLLANLSEFGYRRAFEPGIVGVATDQANDQVLISKATAESENASGVTHKQLKIPASYGAILEEINYNYGDGSGSSLAAPSADMSATTLALEVARETMTRFPTFALGDFHRGDTGIRFGTLPLNIIVPPQQEVRLLWNARAGAGSDDMDLFVSLTVRFEPLWLLEAAGLYLPSSPKG